MFTKWNQSKIYKKTYSLIKGSFLYWPIKKLIANSARFSNDNPSQSLFVIGVTWTNWKTSTSQILSQILNKTTTKTLLINATGIKIWNKIVDGYDKKRELSSFDINSLLAVGRNMGCKIAVLEVSSVELNQFVYEGIQFDAGILTNCTYDHVNYHENFHKYAEAKKKLFKYILKNNKNNKFAVFPQDDKTGRQWAEELPFDKKITFGINRSAILKAENIVESLDWIIFSFSYLGKKYDVKSKLLGAYNAYNILAALWICIEMWISINDAISAVQSISGLKWRMERIHHNWLDIFMDIAYSPNALDKSLNFLKKIQKDKKGRFIIVFWAPWNKDETHRWQIGTIFEKFWSILIVTDSEPNIENRLKIMDELSQNINKKEGENLFVIPEREFAIKFAVEIAKANDIILFACRPRNGFQYTNLGKRNRNDESIIRKELAKKM